MGFAWEGVDCESFSDRLRRVGSQGWLDRPISWLAVTKGRLISGAIRHNCIGSNMGGRELGPGRLRSEKLTRRRVGRVMKFRFD